MLAYVSLWSADLLALGDAVDRLVHEPEHQVQ